MDIITLFGIGVGLSMDALAIAIANGAAIKQCRFRHAFLIAFAFGFAQFLMPLIGWSLGSAFLKILQNYDHWIAFLLLLFVGGKMLYESRELNDNNEFKSCLHIPTLVAMSVATSIDALAVGFSFACLKIGIALPIIIIGATTFTICLIGVYIGKFAGHFLEKKLEIVGGIVLIAIGLRILLEHLTKHI
jgi:putative Mn2+ efflux pump MntP